MFISTLSFPPFLSLPPPSTGFYIQPDVLFFSEQPSSQKVVANSDFSLSCSVQLRGLIQEEGGLNVPVVQWRFNNIYNVSDVRAHVAVTSCVSCYGMLCLHVVVVA